MAQTDQAWDWGVELRDEERSELERLREPSPGCARSSRMSRSPWNFATVVRV
jgi:hypothetical protein